WRAGGATVPANTGDLFLYSGTSRVQSTTSIDGGQVTMFAVWNTQTTRNFQEMNPNLTFTPWWSRLDGSGHSGGTAMRTTRAGQELTFRFRGTSIEFLTQLGPNNGSFDVYINGTRRHRINTHSATTRNQQTVARVTGLADNQNHTVRIISRETGGRSRVVIDRISVTGPSPSISAWPARTEPTINRSVRSPNHGAGAFQSVRWIMLHHTASNNTSGEISWLTNPNSRVSYNYLIAKDGRIWELVPPGRRAWHAGAGPGAPWGIADNNMNAWSIGISLTNLGNGRDPYPEAQLRSLENLIRHLRGTYGHVPVIDHKMWAPGRKPDLSANFPFSRFGFSSPAPRSLMGSFDAEWVDQNGLGGEVGDENWILVEPDWSDDDFILEFEDWDGDSGLIEMLSAEGFLRLEDLEDANHSDGLEPEDSD
ncbi:MAG: N-acetylmuramoyl-L-alanine amidase, partial [Coriobacteriia bacterium]|nr:N-acetylmuramoyl-L-alanine amidase [Coriobacteriia bacterium]